ncbi:hypothetical protein A9Q96_09940 [Rhodobacterales bacterium 52_120_T64]|nr:hypothetical protein A9Q96_09940 [Rhodobacterales bacterium 52_120_T64]
MYGRQDAQIENTQTTMLDGKHRTGLGICVADAFIDINKIQSNIGYVTLWGTTKLELILGVVPTNGKIKLVGINQKAIVEKGVSEVIVKFNKGADDAHDCVLIGKAAKCVDGTIDIQLFGTPFPTSELIIR